jgi:hypothetical protein
MRTRNRRSWPLPAFLPDHPRLPFLLLAARGEGAIEASEALTISAAKRGLDGWGGAACLDDTTEVETGGGDGAAQPDERRRGRRWGGGRRVVLILTNW